MATRHPSRPAPPGASLVHSTTWNGPVTHRALGHPRPAGASVHLAPSAAATPMARRRSRAGSSGKGPGTSLPYPSWARTRHPRSWSTTTARYLWPFFSWLVSSMPARLGPPKREAPPCAPVSSQALPPTPRHPARAMREWAGTRHPAAGHATQSPRSRVCPGPGEHSGLARSMAPRRLVGSWSWRSHLRPQAGHPGCPLTRGPADTTIASPSIAAPPATVLASARTYRRVFAMRPPPVAPDAFGEVESYGRGAPSGPLRGRPCQSYLFPTRELVKAVGGHPHKLPKSQISHPLDFKLLFSNNQNGSAVRFKKVSSSGTDTVCKTKNGFA